MKSDSWERVDVRAATGWKDAHVDSHVIDNGPEGVGDGVNWGGRGGWRRREMGGSNGEGVVVRRKKEGGRRLGYGGVGAPMQVELAREGCSERGGDGGMMHKRRRDKGLALAVEQPVLCK